MHFTLKKEYTVLGVNMKKRMIYVLISLLLIMTFLIIRFSRFYSIACDTYAKNGIKADMTLKINKTIYNHIENNGDYINIVTINRSENGKIMSLSIDSIKINKIVSELTQEIQLSISDSSSYYGFPIGNAFGIKILSGKGFNIGVTVVPIGAVEYELKSELNSCGINQTLHRIILEFNINVSCLSPFHATEIFIKTNLIISETLIMGDVPNILMPFNS